MSMLGFKSFAKHTEFLFGDSFNCILGPNGSGKSNVLDALCFVLGRGSAKSMRAEKSANLIYNGGKSKKPSKFGEVSIVFDNSNKIFPTEDKEVKISRRVRTNGQSVYRIGDKKVTRQQILELLSYGNVDPDGFNIILQGDIVKFVEMHPVERRKIVDEISGLGVYEERKEKALRELNKVDEKMNEAEIILVERKTYLKGLKKEHDQALKFKNLRDKLSENKASYLSLKIKKKTKEQSKLEIDLNKNKSKLDEVNKQVSNFKKNIEEKNKLSESISAEIEQKGETEQVKLHKEVEQLKVDLATNKERFNHVEVEIDKIKQRKVKLKGDFKEQGSKVKDFEDEKEQLIKDDKRKSSELKKLEIEIGKFRKKHHMDNEEGIQKEIEELDQFAEDKTKTIQDVRQKQQDLLRQKDQIEFQIQTLDQQLDKVKKVEKANKVQIKELMNRKQLFKKTTLELNKFLTEDSKLAAQLGDARRNYQQQNERMTSLELRSANVKVRLSGNIAVQKIIEQKSQISGIHGTIAQLGNVSSKHSLALRIAAGHHMNSIVVENDETASQCIKYLKQKKLGVATFLPLNKIKPKKFNTDLKKIIKKQGVHGLAIDLVGFDHKFKKAFDYVFSNVLVIDHIDVARNLGIGSAKMVTLDGDMADISGSMRGGFVHKKAKGLGFAEKEVTKELDSLVKSVDKLRNSITSIEDKRIKNEESIDKSRRLKAEYEGEIIKLEKSLHLESGDLAVSTDNKKSLKENLSKVDAELTSINLEISTLNRELAQNKIKKQALRGKISKLRSPRLVAELNAFEEKKSETKERLIQILSEIKNFDAKISLIAPERDKIDEILKQHDKEIQKFKLELEALNTKIKNNEKFLKKKEQMAKEFYKKYKALFNERSKLTDAINKSQNKIEVLRDLSRKTEIDMNTFSLENARIKSELAGFNHEFKQYEGVKINENKNEHEFKLEIDRFERMASNMGAVNMKALEIYDKVEQEYNNLINKKEKLGEEKCHVLEMIEEIEVRKGDLFTKTFEVINNKFKEVFLALSKKGEAFLELDNPTKPFEGGLNVKVRLSGQKFLDIRSLSGGEKTMTALAFIFAVQEHKPHSFYILDEVDAALDKHNSEKLAKLVRKYCTNAQYIVISHNDAVISEADNLYGVSMNEHGMTKVTSLKL
tara:strand:+ start:6188 stop:9664 length:3477 start_codon:yes stop_codon:yes gene_type:complete